jgi:hypothetical protein
MESQFHGLMQNAAHNKQVGLHSVDQEVARAPYNPGRGADVMPTQPQVPRPDARAQFGAIDAARSIWIGCQFAKGRNDEALVPQPRPLAELFVRPPQDLPDVCLGGVRQAIADHQAAESTFDAARRPN